MGPQFLRQPVSEGLEERGDFLGLLIPNVAVDREQLVQLFAGDVQTGQIQTLRRGDVADGRLDRVRVASAPVQNPLDHSQVLAESGPQELAVLVLAEPIGVEDLGRPAHPPPHLQPMLEVLAHVVTAERQHRHRIAARFALLAELGSRPFRAHRRADKRAVFPVECLVHQRRQVRPPPAENDGRNGHPVMVLGAERVRRTLNQGGRKAAVPVRAQDRVAVGVHGVGSPRFALPVQRLGRRLVVMPFPPHRAVFLQHDVGVDRVAGDRLYHARVGLRARPRRHAEETRLGIDRPQLAVGVDLHPGDVVADGPDPVALLFQTLRGNQHGKVRLAASAGERRRDVLDPAVWMLDPHDQHVLGHPAFLAAKPTGDAQRQALLAQQHVAAVPRSHAPDRVVLGKVHDQSTLDVQFRFAMQALRELAVAA